MVFDVQIFSCSTCDFHAKTRYKLTQHMASNLKKMAVDALLTPIKKTMPADDFIGETQRKKQRTEISRDGEPKSKEKSARPELKAQRTAKAKALPELPIGSRLHNNLQAQPSVRHHGIGAFPCHTCPIKVFAQEKTEQQLTQQQGEIATMTGDTHTQLHLGSQIPGLDNKYSGRWRQPAGSTASG